MSYDPIEYSAVLKDLETRRLALNSRISKMDSAIDGIRGLLEDGAVQPSLQQHVSVSQPRLIEPGAAAITYSALAKPVTQLSVTSDDSEMERRRKVSAVNVYVNRFPEWSRAMARGKTVARKQNGIRCPKCSSTDTRQSLTRGLSDFFMFLFDYSNARCRNCNARFRVWRLQPGQSPQEQVPIVEKFVS
jgi:hypothetical protein